MTVTRMVVRGAECVRNNDLDSGSDSDSDSGSGVVDDGGGGGDDGDDSRAGSDVQFPFDLMVRPQSVHVGLERRLHRVHRFLQIRLDPQRCPFRYRQSMPWNTSFCGHKISKKDQRKSELLGEEI